MRDFAFGRDSIRDTIVLSARSSPVDRLNVGVGGRLELSDTGGGPGAGERYGSVTVDASYNAFSNLDLAGRVTRYERRTGGPTAIQAGAFETSGTVSYHIGRTSASVGWETRKLSMPNAYRHFSASLTRSF